MTIVLTGGGSGGHIMPLLSVAHALKRADPKCRVVYIGLKGDPLTASLHEQLEIFDDIHQIPAGKFRRYHDQSVLAHMLDVRSLALNIRDFFRVLRGMAAAYRLLGKIKPAVVFSKGGYVVVPVGLAAYVRRIPIVTHDSDAAAGLANRIVGRFAKIHATGLPAQHYNYPKHSIRFVGVPIDPRIKPVTAVMQQQLKNQLGLAEDDQMLLIGGAGHGARDINNKVLSISKKLLEQFEKLHIIHFAGQAHAADIAAAYEKQLGETGQRVKVYDFSPEFYKYSGAADLVVSRAGATTIAELAAQRKAVILIPAPQLTGGHQLKNSQILKDQQAVEVVANNADPQKLFDAITPLLSSADKRRKLAEKLSQLTKTDAAKEIAELLIRAAAK